MMWSYVDIGSNDVDMIYTHGEKRWKKGDELWRRSGSAIECRTLDRENTVSNPLHIGAVVTPRQNKNHCRGLLVLCQKTVIHIIFLYFAKVST